LRLVKPEEADVGSRYLFITWEPLFEMVFIIVKLL